MFPVRKRYLFGIFVFGAAAYFGVRWIYKVWNEEDDEDTDVGKGQKDKKTAIKKASSNSLGGKTVSYNLKPSISKSSFQISGEANSRDYQYMSSNGSISALTSRTSNLIFYDTEPNLHFFKIYQDQLAIVNTIPMPRSDRTNQMFCESKEEFLAKVACLRYTFQDILYEGDNCKFFITAGEEILSKFLENSAEEMNNCLEAYKQLLKYVGDVNNHDDIAREIATRRIPMLSFYDLVVDYIILESLDDLESPPSVVASIVSNNWVSAKFRQSACQSAVTTALKYKRSQLKIPNGFFAHFYSVLDHLSPTLAWGFLGSDEELQSKCEFLRESLLGLCRDYFNFDRVRYTSYQDLKSDILEITRERYLDLIERLDL